jgi:glycosyltransferase involved in cell wall biosynthesis
MFSWSSKKRLVLKRKILWLASWYPNKLEPLSGDFIERHARAASMLNDITVIHVVKDHLHKTTGSSTTVKSQDSLYPGLNVITGYYKSHGILGSFFSLLKYFLYQKKLVKEFVRLNGKPDVINVHISFKAALGALYCKWRYGVRYIVSEQWTIFCAEAKPSFQDQPFIVRWLIKKIYKNADSTTAVSKYLSQSLADRFQIQLPVQIPNVVNTDLFFPQEVKYEVFTFIHVSVLNYQKSPDEIIDAVALLRKKTAKPFQVIIYGPFIQHLADKIHHYSLSDCVSYRGEVMQNDLAAEVRKCHSMLLYSRFETFGCVVIEGMAAGLPVIVSDIPVMHELVNEKVNGVFVPLEDPELLGQKMLWMMENYKQFDINVISKSAKEKYSFRKISAEFDQLYRDFISLSC